MTRITLGTTLGVLLGSLGCATTPDPILIHGATFFDFHGTVAESETCSVPAECKSFGYSDYAKTSVNNVSVKSKVPVAKRDLIMSKQIVNLSVVQGGSSFFNYSALVGPNPGSNANVIGLMENSDPTIRLATMGWVLAAGDLPRAKSDWVSGGADGSTIVLQNLSGDLQRFFYLAGNAGVEAKITCLHPPYTEHILTTPRTYVDIKPGCVFDPPGSGASHPIGTAVQAIKDFVDYVEAAERSTR